MHITAEDIAHLENVRISIRQNISVHHKIEELAQLALMSRSNLVKKYKAYFGVSLYADLLHERMQLGKELLENSDEPIKAIAKKCGYKHACNFSGAFKKEFGVGAREFRSE